MNQNTLYQMVQAGKIDPLAFARHMKRLKGQHPSAVVEPLCETYVYDEPYLRDHTIDGKQVLLGVTHAALAINAWFRQNPDASAVHLQRLNFTEPIEVGPGQKAEVRIETQPGAAALDMTARYRVGTENPWRQTAHGRLSASRFQAESVDWAALQAGLTPHPDLSQLYNAGAPVFGVGPSFRVIDHLAVGDGKALATLTLRAGDHHYWLDPLITYSAFTALIPLLTQGLGGAFLPFGIKSLEYQRGEPLRTCHVFVRLVKNSGEMILFDVDLFDAQQRQVARYTGCSIKRLRLPQQSAAEPAARPTVQPTTPVPLADGATPSRIQAYLRGKLADAVGIAPAAIAPDANLMDGGMASMQLVEMAADLEREMGIELDPTLFFEYPNLRELTAYFADQHRAAFTRHLDAGKLTTDATSMTPQPAPPAPPRQPHTTTAPQTTPKATPSVKASEPKVIRVDDIAVIGMAGMFGGAADLDTFWQNLLEGRDVITQVPPDHWDIQPWFHPEPGTEDRTYCRNGSFIENVHGFDREFFNLSEREAQWMDPQVRLLLQTVYAAAEDAGVVKHLRGSKTGVFAGICFADYADELAAANLPISPYSRTAGPEGAANRVSFHFDLKGPSLVFNTACSSALFALHAARQALRNGECETAFVAAANLVLSSQHYRYFSALGSLSQQGRCRSFDDTADGYVPGECVGAVLLKPLARAVAEGDPIHAVIKGSAALHAGYTPSFTAPSVTGQETVLLQAWRDADIDPASLAYIEAHGTATKLGDSIEISALKKALAQHTDKRGFCTVGTVKTHLGHTEGAAGMAGLLKVILQMKHRCLPAMASLSTPSSYLRLDDSPLVLADTTRPWPQGDGPHRAGVSAFGYSGAYAHVVVEEYNPPANTVTRPQTPALVVLSARDAETLRTSAERLRAFILRNQTNVATDTAATSRVLQWETRIRRIVGELLQVAADDIECELSLAEYGVEPVFYAQLAERLSHEQVHVAPAFFLEHPTPARIAAQLALNEAAQPAAQSSALNLLDLAYTLQVGRAEMPQRLGLIAHSLDEAVQLLDDYLAGRDTAALFHEHTARHRETLALFADDEELDTVVTGWYRRGRFERLLGLWVRGFPLDWSRFYETGTDTPQRISLPTYPFHNTPHVHPALTPDRNPTPPREQSPQEQPPATPNVDTHQAAHAWRFLPADAALTDAGGPDPPQKAQRLLRQLIAHRVHLPIHHIAPDAGFLELGMKSRDLVSMVQALSHLLRADLTPGLLFEYTTVTALSDWLVDQYEPQLRAMRVLRRQTPAPPDVTEPAAPAAAPAPRLPLSEGQQGLWFLQKADPTMHTFNCALSFRDTLDSTHFEAACRLLRQRFPILTTVFEEDRHGTPFQVQRPDAPLELHHAPPVTEAALTARLQEHTKLPFDMTRSLFRVTLFPCGKETVVLLNVHHAIFDGSSFPLLLNTLLHFYAEQRAGRQPVVTPPERDYSDYVREQQQLLASEVGGKRLTWWRRQLADMPPRLELPLDTPRAKNPSAACANQTLRFSDAESQRIRAFSQTRAAYPSSFFLGLFHSLLHAYSGQDDIIVGMPVNERGAEDLANIGYYINMVPIRCRDLGRRSFAQILHQCQVTLVDSMAGSLPFPTLVRELGANGSDHHPIFQVAYAYQNFPRGENAAATQPVNAPTLVDGLVQPSNYDLDLEVYDRHNGFELNLRYNADLFTDETVAGLLRHLQALMNAVLGRPDQPIAALNLLSETEVQLTQTTWNATDREYADGDQCMHTLFERQAEKTPDAVALRYEGQSLSYAELEQCTRRLALSLQARGVGPEVRVGVCLERSFDMVVALIGILRAGGAYVPLDPDYPGNRLAYMVDDAAPALILTHTELAAPLPHQDIPLLCLDQPGRQESAEPEATLKRDVNPDNLVYVLYTSGSTGRPKGVMLTHRALVNRILWMQETYDLTPQDCILQKTPFSFDVSGWEFHWPLIVGATLVIAPPGKHKEPRWLCDTIRAQAITMLHFVPSMLKAFLEEDGVAGCTDLRKVFCSGEALTLSLKNRFFERLPDQELHNLYGPTEAAIDVSFHACQPQETTVPIGKPIANTALLILNRAGVPVPRGVPGELCLAGVGLARGYLNRPELTAEKFVPAPDGSAHRPGQRLYRTGDLARRRADGALEYLGRIDHQVKLRGMRIELGEIEAALLRQQGVHHAVVQVRNLHGEQHLVAFYVAGETPPWTPTLLRNALSQELPAYMVPALFHPLPRMPLSANGKIDRRRLANETLTLQSERTYRAPRNPLETQLVALWAEVLGLERVGIADDFFALGGHSLTALKLLARIETTLGRRLPVSVLFQTRQPMLLAAWLDQEKAGAASALIKLQPAGDATPLYFVHGLGGHSLNYLPLSRALGNDQPLFGFQPPGLEDDREPCQSIAQLADAYVATMLAHQPDGPFQLGGWSMGGVIAHAAACKLQAMGKPVSRLILVDSYLATHFQRFAEILTEAGMATDHLPAMAAADPLDQCRAMLREMGLPVAPEEGIDAMIHRGDVNAALALPPQALQRLLRIRCANHEALRHYRPSRSFDGETHYFYALHRNVQHPDQAAPIADADLRGRIEAETRRLWSQVLCAANTRFVLLDSNHDHMIRDPHVHEIAAAIRGTTRMENDQSNVRQPHTR